MNDLLHDVTGFNLILVIDVVIMRGEVIWFSGGWGGRRILSHFLNIN